MGGRVLRGGGELLMTAGLVVLLFVAYLLWWTDVQNAQTQSRLSHQLETQWAAADAAPGVGPAPVGTGPSSSPSRPSAAPSPRDGATTRVAYAPPAFGAALARLYIPRFGADYHPVVVEGTGTADLQQGPGHYAGSALPGDVGNLVISGHRTTWGKPFSRLDEVRPGDHVVVETRTAWVTYRVTGTEIVLPDAGQVIGDAPPPIGDQAGSDRLITLTTCNPRYSAAQRLIVRGVRDAEQPKQAGSLPPALQDGQV